MQTFSLQEAEERLGEIIAQLRPDEEIQITRDNQPIATIRAATPKAVEAPRFGTLKGTIQHVAPDFDAIPEGFEDYLP